MSAPTSIPPPAAPRTEPTRAAALRLWRWLDRPDASRRLRWQVPLAFGVLSLLLGQDVNWDLMNYHRYNPHALLGGRVGVDLAPGQWQGYFNPAIDLLYHFLFTALPAPLAGFLLGALHGCNFVLVLGIARGLLPGVRRPLLLALAGCLGAGFLSELGNTMGDNLTALCVLGAVYLLLARFEQVGRAALGRVLAAGLLIGLGTGLKLTNAVYALALCLALLSAPGAWWQRLRAAFLFGLATLSGIGAAAGFWYWKMWQVFGNPLFPQFNNIFQAPLAAPIGIGDTAWLPQGWLERLLWPFIFTLNPRRVIELPMRQLIWPMVYVLFLALLAALLVRLMTRPITRPITRQAGAGALAARALTPRSRFVLLFFALSYVLWLGLFSIYRYLVPVELLAPLVAWLLLHRLLPPARAAQVGAYALALAAVAVFPFATWGHAKWHWQAFRAEVPALPNPRQSMVFIVHGDPPMSWTVPFFPPQLVFASIGAGFPESAAYHARMRAMVAARSGPFYVIMAYRHRVRSKPDPKAEQHDAAVNAARLAASAHTMDQYGFVMDAASCRPYKAYMGRQLTMYQLCAVTPKARI